MADTHHENHRREGSLSEQSTTLRPLSCELGPLKHCDGSASWKSGHTSVLAAVHGPLAPRQAQYESSHAATVSVVIKGGGGAAAGRLSSELLREWEAFVTQQLQACIVTERYPRTIISIVVQILNHDGSVLAASLHAAEAALMDASIDMNLLPTAVTCCRVGGHLQLDPTNEEEQQTGASVMVLVFAGAGRTESLNNNNILGCHTTASMRQTTTHVLEGCAFGSRAVPAVRAFWRLAIEQKVTRESQTLWSS